ncbi:30S ribosomal protein S12 methylthiotransferase RimO [bacterium]|nr:30S ribosomal protein S12 methylthiotransferase RimO [candidate division CSSED10-310 bacterium]
MNPVFHELPRVFLVNLGCHKNQVDAEVILGALDEAGFPVVGEPDTAEVIIVNTCGFLRAAREESVDALREMAAFRIQGALRRLVVTGCMADRDRKYLSDRIPGIDLFLSPFQLDRIPEALLSVQSSPPPLFSTDFRWPDAPRWLSTPRSFGFVKIADGCDNRCAYCRIPVLRGPFRSKPLQDVIQECEEVIATGRREIVLLAQDTTRYGADDGGKGCFTELVEAISRLDGLKWLRLMYLYPSHIELPLLDVMSASNTICRYLDIPLQHVHPRIVTAMNRSMPGWVDAAEDRAGSAADFIAAIRRRVPGITIRTTLMTGFPGETEAEFEAMAAFIEAGHIDHLGIFPWSPEPDTVAARLPGRVDPVIAEEWAERLMMLQADIVSERNRRRLGEIVEVVIDGAADDGLEGEGGSVTRVSGRMAGQAPEVDGEVRISGAYADGTWLRVRLIDCDVYDFEGEVVSEEEWAMATAMDSVEEQMGEKGPEKGGR